MKKQIRKGMAFSLLAAMAMTSALQVRAVEIGTGSVASDEKTVSFVKDLTLKDVDSDTTPQTPGVTFSYTITAGTEETVEVSHDNITEKITYKAGVGDPQIGTAAFSKSDTAIDKNGKKVVSKNVEVDFNGVTFSEAGVYRYVITEQDYRNTDGYDYTEADLPSIDEHNKTRNLDVYVNKKADGGFEITGYVISKKKDGVDTKGGGFTEDSTPIYDETGTTTPTGGATAVASSVYHTHDITLSKEIEGDMIEEGKDFTFIVSLPNQTDGSYELYKGADKQTNATGRSVNLTLKKGEKYSIKGLPISSSLTISENDYSADGYDAPTVKSDDSDGTMNLSDGKYSLSNVVSNGKDNDATDIVVTNHRKNVPPTGILWSIAPYAAMVGLAVVLGVFFLKKRRYDA